RRTRPRHSWPGDLWRAGLARGGRDFGRDCAFHRRAARIAVGLSRRLHPCPDQPHHRCDACGPFSDPCPRARRVSPPEPPQPPAPSLGSMLNAAQRFLTNAPWMAIWPGLAIFLVVLSFNLVGDGLRDALDPRER